MASARSQLYRAARILGDVEAAKKGPKAYLKRRGRRIVYRQTGQLGRVISRALSL